jgi:hypothetical protein
MHEGLTSSSLGLAGQPREAEEVVVAGGGGGGGGWRPPPPHAGVLVPGDRTVWPTET